MSRNKVDFNLFCIFLLVLSIVCSCITDSTDRENSELNQDLLKTQRLRLSSPLLGSGYEGKCFAGNTVTSEAKISLITQDTVRQFPHLGGLVGNSLIENGPLQIVVAAAPLIDLQSQWHLLVPGAFLFESDSWRSHPNQASLWIQFDHATEVDGLKIDRTNLGSYELVLNYSSRNRSKKSSKVSFAVSNESLLPTIKILGKQGWRVRMNSRKNATRLIESKATNLQDLATTLFAPHPCQPSLAGVDEPTPTQQLARVTEPSANVFDHTASVQSTYLSSGEIAFLRWKHAQGYQESQVHMVISTPKETIQIPQTAIRWSEQPKEVRVPAGSWFLEVSQPQRNKICRRRFPSGSLILGSARTNPQDLSSEVCLLPEDILTSDEELMMKFVGSNPALKAKDHSSGLWLELRKVGATVANHWQQKRKQDPSYGDIADLLQISNDNPGTHLRVLPCPPLGMPHYTLVEAVRRLHPQALEFYACEAFELQPELVGLIQKQHPEIMFLPAPQWYSPFVPERRIELKEKDKRKLSDVIANYAKEPEQRSRLGVQIAAGAGKSDVRSLTFFANIKHIGQELLLRVQRSGDVIYERSFVVSAVGPQELTIDPAVPRSSKLFFEVLHVPSSAEPWHNAPNSKLLESATYFEAVQNPVELKR